MEEGKGRVCVTGGTGFIASWLIMRLLGHGYSVTTTVRSELDPGMLLITVTKAKSRVANTYNFLINEQNTGIRKTLAS